MTLYATSADVKKCFHCTFAINLHMTLSEEPNLMRAPKPCHHIRESSPGWAVSQHHFIVAIFRFLHNSRADRYAAYVVPLSWLHLRCRQHKFRRWESVKVMPCQSCPPVFLLPPSSGAAVRVNDKFPARLIPASLVVDTVEIPVLLLGVLSFQTR